MIYMLFYFSQAFSKFPILGLKLAYAITVPGRITAIRIVMMRYNPYYSFSLL